VDFAKAMDYVSRAANQGKHEHAKKKKLFWPFSASPRALASHFAGSKESMCVQSPNYKPSL
jgi:hypothetical protein